MTLNNLHLTALGSNPAKDFPFMWGTYPAFYKMLVGSTQGPAGVWNKAQRGTGGLPPPLKAGKVTVWL